jgi:hypothetical protein
MDPLCLDKVEFPLLPQPGSTSFVDPATVIRTCHLIPDFAKGLRYSESSDHGTSAIADDRNDWVSYYINRYVFIYNFKNL